MLGGKSDGALAAAWNFSLATGENRMEDDCGWQAAETANRFFEGDTLVKMADGSWRKISELRVGDRVLAVPHGSVNEAATACEVTAIESGAAPAWQLTFVNSGGETLQFTASEGHPFYVDGRGWVDVKELLVGDIIVAQNGSTFTLSSKTFVAEVVTWSLTVAENHTFFVGDGLGNEVVVHNVDYATGPGHHFFPKIVAEKALRAHIIERNSFEYILQRTVNPEVYKHGADTWNGVTHAKYSQAITELFESFAKSNGGTASLEQVKDFLRWAETGISEGTMKTFLAKHSAQYGAIIEQITHWRGGFYASCGVGIELKAIGGNLTDAEIKKLTQVLVNGADESSLSAGAKKALAVLRKSHNIADSGIARKLGAMGLKTIAKKAVPIITFVSVGLAVQNGYASNGSWGAFEGGAREVAMADLVEGLVSSVGKPFVEKGNAILNNQIRGHHEISGKAAIYRELGIDPFERKP